jgi:hypothetical protein
MDDTGTANQNPALKELDILGGEWKMELSNASFLPDPSATMTGKLMVEWREHGAFLALFMGSNPGKAPDATWLIGRDETLPDYVVLYYDNRQVSRVYGMSLSDGIWKMWRSSPGFSQRFEGKLSRDGNTITAYWEKSSDGEIWEHDFDVRYSKVR